MKISKIARSLVLVLTLGGAVACTQQKPANEESQTTSTKITDKPYICPMKCEGSASDKPGKCPMCAMELENNPDYRAPADATEVAAPADSLKK